MSSPWVSTAKVGHPSGAAVGQSLCFASPLPEEMRGVATSCEESKKPIGARSSLSLVQEMPQDIVPAAFPHSESVVFRHGRWWVEEGRGRLHSKGERLQGSESIETNIAAECRGENIFLHHGIETHRTRDVEPERGHISPKGRHSRCTRLHRAYFDDLAIQRAKKGTAESVRRVVGPSERLRIGATPAPMEDVGGPSRTTARYSHPSGILQRIHDAIFHQDVHYKVGCSGGWASHGLHNLPYPVVTGDADPTEGGWVKYPTLVKGCTCLQ